MATGDEDTRIGSDTSIDRPRPTHTREEEVTGSADIARTPAKEVDYLSDEGVDLSLADAEREVASLLSKSSRSAKEILSGSASKGNFNFNQLKGIFNRNSSKSVTTIPAWFTRNVSMTSMLKIHDFQRTSQLKYMTKSLSLAYKRTSLLRNIYDRLGDIGVTLLRKTDAVKVNTGVSAEIDYSTKGEAFDPFKMVKDMVRTMAMDHLKNTGKDFITRILDGKSIAKSLDEVRKSHTGTLHDTTKQFLGETSRLTRATGAIHRSLAHLPGRGFLKEGSYLSDKVDSAAKLYNNYVPDFIKDKLGIRRTEKSESTKQEDLETLKDSFQEEWRDKQLRLLQEIRDSEPRVSRRPLPGERPYRNKTVDIEPVRKTTHSGVEHKEPLKQITYSPSKETRQTTTSTHEVSTKPTIKTTTRIPDAEKVHVHREIVEKITESPAKTRHRSHDTIRDTLSPTRKKHSIKERILRPTHTLRRRASIATRRLLRKRGAISSLASISAAREAVAAALGDVKAKTISASTQHYNDALAKAKERLDAIRQANKERREESKRISSNGSPSLFGDLGDYAKSFIGEYVGKKLFGKVKGLGAVKGLKNVGRSGLGKLKGLIPKFGKMSLRTAGSEAASIGGSLAKVGRFGKLASMGLGVGKALTGGIAGLVGDAILDKVDGSIDAHTKQGSSVRRLGHTATAAGKGAITGAMIGSFIPIIGTTVGAALGAGTGALLANTDLISKGLHNASDKLFGTKSHIDNQGNFIPGKDGVFGTLTKGFSAMGMMFAKAGATDTGVDVSKIKDHVGGAYSPLNYDAAVPMSSSQSKVGDNATFRVATSPNRYKVVGDGAYKAVLKGLPKELAQRLNETHNQGLVYAVYSTARQFGAKEAIRIISSVWQLRSNQSDDELINGIFQVRASSINKGDHGHFANRIQATAITSKERDLAMNISSGKSAIDYDALAASTSDNRGNSAEAANDNAQYQSTFSQGKNNFKVRGLRNNNPGNIRWSKLFKQYGAVPESTGDNPGFAVFPTMEEGVAQMRNQIGRYQTERKWGKVDTIEDIIAKWAPPNENNTRQYINYVAKQLGVGPNDHLGLLNGKQVSTVMKAISVMENGNVAKTIFPVIDKVLAPETSSDPAASKDGSGAPTPNAMAKPKSTPAPTVPSSRGGAMIARSTPARSTESSMSTTRGSSSIASGISAESRNTVVANNDPKLLSHTESISSNSNTTVSILQKISQTLEASHELAKQNSDANKSKTNSSPVVVNNMNNSTVVPHTGDSLSFSNNRERHAHIG